jgi:hypothetical protein
MRSIEHHCCLVARRVGLLLELDPVQHLDLLHCRHHPEHYFGSLEDHSQGVVGDPKVVAAVGAKAVVHLAPSLFSGSQSCSVEDVDLGVVAFGVGRLDATSADLAEKSSMGDAVAAAVDEARTMVQPVVAGDIVAVEPHSTFGGSAGAAKLARHTYDVGHVQKEKPRKLENWIVEYDRLEGMGASSARLP